MAGVDPSRARRYVQAGVLRPARVDDQQELYGDTELARLRKIRRLSAELGLNAAGIEVALRLLDEIESLRAELARYSPVREEESEAR
jgi:DNA-binding transcriptional MerR regulator